MSGQAWGDEASVPKMPLKAMKPPEMKRWPPHRPSTRYAFSGEAMKPYRDGPEAAILDDFEDTLYQAGYRKVVYFALPDGGVAFATPFERMNGDGSPVHDNRFDLAYSERLTIVGWKPVPRHLRAFLFLLSQNRLPVGQSPKSFSQHRRGLESGITLIGPGMQFGRVTAQHRLTVFEYEYYTSSQADPQFLEDSKVPCLEQLKKTGIIS
jgi:hypothetical protein